MDSRRSQRKTWKTKGDMARYTERKLGRDGYGVWTGVTRERLPAIVADGEWRQLVRPSSPDAPLGTGGTKSNCLSKLLLYFGQISDDDDE